ncbi:hypothetical protein GCM10010082_31250 [Kushneria pakistanensis]|uniref:Uncharacterized protein n=1 Tax=Kushneria pakistanensis TaxID=1508770 RepID=A0ABQ3FQP3_9GAMM|nr:hypothetical protein GCM10010082_31250 [Kushneria pakistanensis]
MTTATASSPSTPIAASTILNNAFIEYSLRDPFPPDNRLDRPWQHGTARPVKCGRQCSGWSLPFSIMTYLRELMAHCQDALKHQAARA